MSPDTPISVSELNRLARLGLERAVPICWVSGEISNLSRAASGHWYFTLKDTGASVRCAMFRNRNQFVDWSPREGEHVEVRAQATLYEARGDFQLSVEAMRHAGQGALYEAFLRLKAKLEGEGLFDPARKRPLPAYPTSIGLITSPRGAAVQDALVTLQRRWPRATVVLYPVHVQGEQAPAQIVDALRLAATRGECEVILLIRGGGSLEDLRAFNDEGVARAIAASPLPIVAGIGHETDFSIADFVADLRAPTPTAAAQWATPDRLDLEQRRQQLTSRLAGLWQRQAGARAQTLDRLARSLRHPAERLQAVRARFTQAQNRLAAACVQARRGPRASVQALTFRLMQSGQARPRRVQQHLQHDLERLMAVMHAGLGQARHDLDRRGEQLALLSPRAVLGRGYALVRDSTGVVIRSPQQVQDGQTIHIDLANGGIGASVKLD